MYEWEHKNLHIARFLGEKIPKKNSDLHMGHIEESGKSPELLFILWISWHPSLSCSDLSAWNKVINRPTANAIPED